MRPTRQKLWPEMTDALTGEQLNLPRTVLRDGLGWSPCAQITGEGHSSLQLIDERRKFTGERRNYHRDSSSESPPTRRSTLVRRSPKRHSPDA